MDDDLSVAEVSVEQRNQLAVISLPVEEHGACSCLVRVYTEIEPLLPLKKNNKLNPQKTTPKPHSYFLASCVKWSSKEW